MGATFYFPWEPVLMEWLQQNLSPFLMAVSKLFTAMGSEILMIGIMGYYYWCRDKKAGIRIGLDLVLALVFNPMVKNAVCRRRPYFDNPGVKCLVPVDGGADIYDTAAQGFSFPSGHATNSLMIYGLLSLEAKKRVFKAGLSLIPVFVGLSRIVVGVHYPTDVICGWLLAAAVCFLSLFLQKRITDRRLLFSVMTLLGLPGFFWCRTDDYYSGMGVMIGVFASILFEEKYVRFENTKSIKWSVFRIAGGMAVFALLNSLLKVPFTEEFLGSGTFAAFSVRTARYAVVSFVDMGLYPMVFAKIEGGSGKRIRIS